LIFATTLISDTGCWLLVANYSLPGASNLFPFAISNQSFS